jgi:hypothetical protein
MCVTKRFFGEKRKERVRVGGGGTEEKKTGFLFFIFFLYTTFFVTHGLFFKKNFLSVSCFCV